VLQCVVVCCSALQCVAVCYSLLAFAYDLALSDKVGMIERQGLTCWSAHVGGPSFHGCGTHDSRRTR